MAKTKEELDQIKQECEALVSKLKELTDDELKLVTGGKLIDHQLQKYIPELCGEINTIQAK